MAELYMCRGSTYLAKLKRDKVGECFDKMLSIRKKVFGEDSFEYIEALMAKSFQYLGDGERKDETT